MSKKDYTGFSKQRVETQAEEIQNGVVEPVVESVVEEPKMGVVTDCLKLNVREKPNSDSQVLCVINASSNVVIEEEESTYEFYKVCTEAGIEGFCMKKFITIL